MNGNHKIRSLGVHTRFGSEALAMECRKALNAFVGGHLPRIMDEVFSSRSSPGLIRRFGRVELDLGAIPRDEFPDGIEERLRKKLADFLDDHPVLPEPVSSATSSRQLPSGAAEEETILYFLETGILPWYGSFSNAGDMAASLEKTLETGAIHFIKRLKDASDMQTMVKRLTRQFPKSIIEKILETVAPGRGRSTRAIIRRLDACYAAGTIVKAGKDPGSRADTVQEIKDHLWEHILLITLGGRGISHKRLKLDLPQHASPESRQEISRILGEVILGCFDALADDTQIKGERDPHQAITDRPLANCPGKQTSGDPGLSATKGKSVRESTGKDVVNEAIEERVLNNSPILIYPGARTSRPHFYCGRDARAPRLNYSGRVPESDNWVRAKAVNTISKNGITKDEADTGVTGQSTENNARPGHGDSRDANPEPVSPATSPRQIPSVPAEEGAILHFLETGILPGYGSLSKAGDTAASLEKWLETGAAHFINRLKDAPDMKTMVKRLTRQFPETIIEKILETVAPGRGRSTREVIRRLDTYYAAGTAGKARKDPGRGADTVQEIKDYVWEHILLITLGGRGISRKLLKLEIQQYFSPEARQEISRILRHLPGSNAIVSAGATSHHPDPWSVHPSFWSEKIQAAFRKSVRKPGRVADPDLPRIWGEVILRCFDALADDIQVKRDLESHQAITDRPYDHYPDKQTPGDSRLSPAKGKPIRESTIYLRWIKLLVDCLGAMADEDASPMSSFLSGEVLSVIGDVIFQAAVSTTKPEVFLAELSSMVAGQLIGGKKSSKEAGRVSVKELTEKFLYGVEPLGAKAHRNDRPDEPVSAFSRSFADEALEDLCTGTGTLWQIILSEAWGWILTSGLSSDFSGPTCSSNEEGFDLSMMDSILSLAPEEKEPFSIRILFRLAERMQLPITSCPDHPGPEVQSGTPNAPGAGKIIFKALETAGHSGLLLGQGSVSREADRSVPCPGREDRYDSLDTNPSISTGLKRWSELLGNPAVQKKLRSSLNLEDIWDMIQAILHWKSREPDLETVGGRFKSDACAQSCKSLDEKRDDSRDQLADKLSLVLKSGPDPKDFLFRVLTGLVSNDPHQEHNPGDKLKSSVPESGKLKNLPGEKHLKQFGGSRPTWNSSGSQRVTAVGKNPAAASREWGRGAEPVFVENAGMVLSGPYLPMLFRKLDLLDKKEFKSHYAAEKAVHILEYMVTGEQSAPEYRLVLNKLLCGMEPDRPIHKFFLLEKAETDLTRELILSIIAHWKVLGKTSVEGFRQSFLTREGRLEATEDAWTLVVAPKPFDMLLDRIPWTFSPIRFPWMDRVLHVRWR